MRVARPKPALERLIGRCLLRNQRQKIQRKELPVFEQNYFNWQIDGNRASRRMPDGQTVYVDLHRGHRVVAEGWWPAKPPLIPSTAVTGVCLWDASWQVRLDSNHNGKPSWRSPAMPAERGDIIRELEKGRRYIGAVRVPDAPNTYHHLLVAWQASRARELGVERIIFALPRAEYHAFIHEQEELGEIDLSDCHQHLDQFTDEVERLVMEEFSGFDLSLTSPLGDGLTSDPEESFLCPYAFPDLYGVRQEQLVGLEDLVELRLSYLASRRSGCDPTPVNFVVTRIPHPYTEREHKPCVELTMRS